MSSTHIASKRIVINSIKSKISAAIKQLTDLGPELDILDKDTLDDISGNMGLISDTASYITFIWKG